MSWTRTLPAVVIACGAAVAVPPAPAQEAPAAGSPGIEAVAFMAGCWEGDLGDGATIRETYTAPRGGAMLGNSQLTAGGETQFFEFSRIAAADGAVTYNPQPMGGPSVSFTLVRWAPGEAVFENPEHDHPQRIVYRLEGEGRLTARVELLDGGRAQRFEMRAVPCAGQAAAASAP